MNWFEKSVKIFLLKRNPTVYLQKPFTYPIDKTQFANKTRKVSERQKFVCGQTTLSF